MEIRSERPTECMTCTIMIQDLEELVEALNEDLRRLKIHMKSDWLEASPLADDNLGRSLGTSDP